MRERGVRRGRCRGVEGIFFVAFLRRINSLIRIPDLPVSHGLPVD